MEKKLKVKMYKGMASPTVEIPADELAQANGAACSPPTTDPPPQIISVSLESLKADLHDQTYGMMACSTGCMSNPGGPGC